MGKPAQINVQTLWEEISKLKNYIFNMNNQLKYNLSNLEADDFASGEAPAQASILDRITNLERNQSTTRQTDSSITAAISALGSTVGGHTTAIGVKVTTFAQNSPPEATAIGDIWIDTNDSNKLYRASAVGSANWVLYKVASGYVNTPGATVDDTGIALAEGGVFTAFDGFFGIDADGDVLCVGPIGSIFAHQDSTPALLGLPGTWAALGDVTTSTAEVIHFWERTA